jgi:hypothetical protein
MENATHNTFPKFNKTWLAVQFRNFFHKPVAWLNEIVKNEKFLKCLLSA